MINKTKVMCVFVPDPFIALYFKKCYEIWKDETDGLLVQVNGCRKEVVDFIADLYKEEFVIKHYHHSNQGIAFDELYKHFDADILGTMCSDNFVFKKGVITDEISKLYQYDAIGSSGLHVRPPEMADKIAKKFTTCRLNPFMSFWRADKLKEIEPFTFQSVIMPEGSTIAGMEFSPEGWLDCMVQMYIKFAERGNKVFIHGADNPPKWIHASGLSSGVYGHFRHSDGHNLAGNDRKMFDANLHLGLLGWWWKVYHETVGDCPLKDFNKEYLTALKEKIKISGYTDDQVAKEAEKLNKEIQ